MSEVVVITGASAGIGRACVREFAQRKSKIGLVARGHDGLQAAQREVEALGGEAIVLPTDVSDHEAVERAASAVEERFGPIDVWVNDAFTNVFAEFLDIEPDEYRRVTEVTYLGFVWGTRAALRRMLPRNHGTIVQVASAVTYRSIPLQAAYSGSKAAIRGFTDAIRCELHHHDSNVHMCSVNMPAVNTPQFSWNRAKLPRKPQPVPPIYQPEIAARAVYYAAHHRRREVTVGSSSLLAINANKFAADLLDRYLGATGYDSQQYDGGLEPGRPDNLYAPVPGDHGAHGDFDARAKSQSLELAITTAPRILGGFATALGLFIAAKALLR
jgi:short-subunit dehydrogenase